MFPRFRVNKQLLNAIPCLLALALFTACGTRSSTIRVSSKEFTEQLLLGQITLLTLEDAGYKVEDKTGIAGSNKLRSALLNKDIDIYWEYTGTGWLSHLQHDNRLADSQVCYESVRNEDRKNGVEWLNYAPVNNTYTVMMRKAQADTLGIKTLSQLAAHMGRLSFAVDHEFTARPDGLPGLEAAYGFKMTEDRTLVMDNAIIYKALRDGQADIGMGFATDGRIQAFKLVNIEDDKKFFPAYNPSPNLRVKFAQENPRIVDILNKVSAKLDTKTVMRLNYLVDIEQNVPRDVAKSWLKEAGLIKP
jgi:osmoprotectant transport system substrate-binding protein